MYTHRGAWVNAIGEIVEHGLNQRSVYLWTLPMFHCNGWCFTWAVTAAGGRHICLRRPDPAEALRLIEAEGVTHLCGAPWWSPRSRSTAPRRASASRVP